MVICTHKYRYSTNCVYPILLTGQYYDWPIGTVEDFGGSVPGARELCLDENEDWEAVGQVGISYRLFKGKTRSFGQTEEKGNR